MTTRVRFIAPAVGRALREARFSGGPHQAPHGPEVNGPEDGLDPSGVRDATAAREILRVNYPFPGRVFVSPSSRCLHTARILGLDGVPVGELAPCAMGRWRGKTLDEVSDAEPQSVAEWLADPVAAPHGGESLVAVLDRVARWLDALEAETNATTDDPWAPSTAATDPGTWSATAPDRTQAREGARSPAPDRGRVTVVAEPDIVRAAAVHALGAAPGTFWRFDVRPLSVTELNGRGGRWNLLSGRPLRHAPTG